MNVYFFLLLPLLPLVSSVVEERNRKWMYGELSELQTVISQDAHTNTNTKKSQWRAK